MSNQVKGILLGVLMSLLAVAGWIVLWFLNFIAGIAGAGMGILFIWGYGKFNEKKPKYITMLSIILIIAEIILAELICIAILISGSGLAMAEVLADSEVQGAVALDLGLGFFLSFVCYFAFLFAKNRKKPQGKKFYTTDISNQNPDQNAPVAFSLDGQQGAADIDRAAQDPFSAGTDSNVQDNQKL